MRQIRCVVFHGVAAAIGAILFGLPFFGIAVFKPHYAPFQFVVLGVAVGLLLGASLVVTIPQYIAVTALVWVAHVLVVGSRTWPFIVRDAAFVLGLSAAVLVSQQILARAGNQISIVRRTFLRAGVLFLGYVAAGASLYAAWGVENWTYQLGLYGQLGLVLAVGSVVGVELGQALAGRRRMGIA